MATEYLSMSADAPAFGKCSWTTLKHLLTLGFARKEIQRAVALGHMEGHWRQTALDLENRVFSFPLADLAKAWIEETGNLFVGVPATAMLSDDAMRAYVRIRVQTSGTEQSLVKSGRIR